jgi:hypothetical protein
VYFPKVHELVLSEVNTILKICLVKLLCTWMHNNYQHFLVHGTQQCYLHCLHIHQAKQNCFKKCTRHKTFISLFFNFGTIRFLFNKYSVSYVSYKLEGTQNCKTSCKVSTIVCYFDHKQNVPINFSSIPSTKFHENPIGRSKFVSCMQKTDSTILKEYQEVSTVNNTVDIYRHQTHYLYLLRSRWFV